MNNDYFYKKLICAIARYAIENNIDLLSYCQYRPSIALFILHHMGEEEGIKILRQLSQCSPSFTETDIEHCCIECNRCADKANLCHLVCTCKKAGMPYRDLYLTL